MAVTLVTGNHGAEIESLLDGATSQIRIISPFMGTKTCERLAFAVNAARRIKCRIITRFYREDFIQNASSIDGLLALLDAGAEIRALRHLHTKLYLFDDSRAILTSANYTHGGLYSNIELGIKIETDDEEEDDILGACVRYFEDLWKCIEEYNRSRRNEAIVTRDLLIKEKEIVDKLTTERKGLNADSFNSFKFGAELPRTASKDLIETMLQQVKSPAPSHDIWLKFCYGAQERCDPNAECPLFKEMNFPKRPVGIKEGQRIFIAVHSRDKDNNPAPIIIGRGYSYGFNEDNVKDGERHPYYIVFKESETLKGPAVNGLLLSDVYQQLGDDTYLSTVGTGAEFEALKRRERQMDKIRITALAEECINRELDKLFARYGVNRLP